MSSTTLSYLEGPPIPHDESIPPTAIQTFLNIVDAHPDSLALASIHQSASLFEQFPSLPPPPDASPPQDPYIRWTYRTLKQAVDRFASSLLSRGVIPSETPIVTFLPQCAEYLVTKLAAHLLGCPLVPLSPKSLINEDEIAHVFSLISSHAGSTGTGSPSSSFVIVSSTTPEVPIHHPSVLRVLTTSTSSHPEPAPEGWTFFHSLLNSPSPSQSPSFLPSHTPTAADTTLILTSGTTSTPKLCRFNPTQLSFLLPTLVNRHRHRHHNHHHLDNDHDDHDDPYSNHAEPVLCSAPNNHVAGNESIWRALAFGGTVIFPSAGFDPRAFLSAARWEGGRYAVLVPTMVVALSASVVAAASGAGAGAGAGPTEKQQQQQRREGQQQQQQQQQKDKLGLLKTEQKLGLRCISIGGAPVTKRVLELCCGVETKGDDDDDDDDGSGGGVLGCERVEVVFGSTEGAFLRSGEKSVKELLSAMDNNNNDGKQEAAAAVAAVAVAPVSFGLNPGEKIKVCRPGDGGGIRIVKRGEVGELHFCGRTLCAGYVGEDQGGFYEAQGGERWYNTGDMAMIDEREDRVYVMGRYKDVIIRGGENIAPAAVEAVLEPSLGYLGGIQVVGAPDEDEVAGEVVVVVTQKKVDAETAVLVRDTIVKKMGAAYAPDEVLSLQELGLADYPRTAVGKVKKHKLAEVVRIYLAGRRARTKSGADRKNATILDHLVRVWSQAIGIYDQERFLSPDTVVSTLPVDSIAIMRVRDRLAKVLGGKTLSLADIAEHPEANIRELAALLESNPDPETEIAKANGTTNGGKKGPPETQDMVHLMEDPSLSGPTKSLVTEAISRYGLSWDQDVEAVFPTSDFSTVSLRFGSMYHLNLKMVLITKNNTTKSQLREALHRVIANNPMISSFIVADEKALGRNLALHVHVNTALTDFLDTHIISDGGSLESPIDLVNFARSQHYPAVRDAVPPGPLSKMWLFDVNSASSAGLVINGSHAIYDATFSQLVYEDLEAALSGQPLRPHTPYKLWAESYFTLRHSPAARAAISYHTSVLSPLSKHKSSIWPTHPPVYLPRTLPTTSSSLEDTSDKGHIHVFDVPPGWLKLMSSSSSSAHNLAASIPLKAALALFLTRRTSTSFATFAHVEACRSDFPFLPRSLSRPATDVAGLTIQSVINLIHVPPLASSPPPSPPTTSSSSYSSSLSSKPETITKTTITTTVLDFLANLQRTQSLQTAHASAPRALLLDSLPPSSAELVPWISATTVFNWVGVGSSFSNENQYSRFRVVDVILSKQMFGFFVMAGMVISEEKGVAKCWMRVHGASFDSEELKGFAEEMEGIVRWLTEEGNWEREIGEWREGKE